jgi:hypothetical protein
LAPKESATHFQRPISEEDKTPLKIASKNKIRSEIREFWTEKKAKRVSEKLEDKLFRENLSDKRLEMKVSNLKL